MLRSNLNPPGHVEEVCPPAATRQATSTTTGTELGRGGCHRGASGHWGPSCGKQHHKWAAVWVWDCLGTENVLRPASATGAIAIWVNSAVISDHLFAKRGISLRAWSSLHRWLCKSCGTVFAGCLHHIFIYTCTKVIIALHCF